MEAESIVTAQGIDGVRPPGPPRSWSESCYFDFANRDGTVGGFLRVGEQPWAGCSSWWVYVVGRDGSVPLRAGQQMEQCPGAVRGGPFHLQSQSLTCHVERAGADGPWRLSAEAADFALDVSWRATADPYHYRRGRRYEQAGWARGTVTIGSVTRPVDGPGQRDHSWGVRDWWRVGWLWCAGWLSDGQRFQATQLEARDRVDPDGYVLVPGKGVSQVLSVEMVRPPGEGRSREIRLDGRSFVLDDVATETLDLDAPDGRSSRLIRSLTTVRCPDGRRGVAWFERNTPSARPSRPA